MIVLDIYGKIDKILISEKLKLYIANLPNDWKEGIREEIFEELRRIDFSREEQLLKYGEVLTSKFDYELGRKTVEMNIEDFNYYKLETLEDCIECLLDNMIFIEFDYGYEDMPFFDWTTNCFDGRFCEGDYSERIIKLFNFLNHERYVKAHFNIVYSSNENYFSIIPRITSVLSFRVESKFDGFRTKDEAITDLRKCGQCIDEFLQTGNDYYKLDFIAESLKNSDDYKHYHFLKTFTLLEMLLIKKDQHTKEIDKFINPIIKKIYTKNSEDATILLRQMRNKIGHGDFSAFNKKAEMFAQKYMSNYQFDYTEYSRSNWILLHTCCLLDDILKEVLIQKLNIDKYFPTAY
ncbi:hypothetical protein KPL26_08530 [Clostridium algidicarnis]|uniref:hypothetical protein n=1 Tax=Clostridium algidicarnis TaxID=37659 RepID=UPI001C0B824B|nr:hypothetical protein [Clostridium algidicarnis]MBU3196719.1 hypothetical protein [Clostridium algidicarnis]